MRSTIHAYRRQQMSYLEFRGLVAAVYFDRRNARCGLIIIIPRFPFPEEEVGEFAEATRTRREASSLPVNVLKYLLSQLYLLQAMTSVIADLIMN